MNNSIGMAKPPKSHQHLILNLCNFINDNVDDNFLALPESNLAEGDQFSKIPDVLVFDKEECTNAVAIEIEQKANIKATIKKVQQYIIDLSVTEGFVVQYKPVGDVDYHIEKWYKVTGFEVLENDTFSELLDIDFEDEFNC
jgi:hypothetical protein